MAAGLRQRRGAAGTAQAGLTAVRRKDRIVAGLRVDSGAAPAALRLRP